MNTTAQVIAGAAILLAVLAAVVLLAWHATISGGEAVGVITTVLGLGGGALAVHAGVKAGATAAGKQ